MLVTVNKLKAYGVPWRAMVTHVANNTFQNITYGNFFSVFNEKISSWSQTSWLKIYKTYAKTFASPSRKGVVKEKRKAIEKKYSYLEFSHLLLPVAGNSFSSKVKIRQMLSRLFEYIFQKLHKIMVYGGVFIFKIPRILSFTGALKTHFLLFPKKFSSQTRV